MEMTKWFDANYHDIVPSIADLDADVLSIEASRSGIELLDAFAAFRYPYQIGPGIYDIHSPRIPSEAEMMRLLEKAAAVLTPEQIGVNPDCGLKTRRWDEVEPALTRMVAAARGMRQLQGGVRQTCGRGDPPAFAPAPSSTGQPSSVASDRRRASKRRRRIRHADREYSYDRGY